MAFLSGGLSAQERETLPNTGEALESIFTPDRTLTERYSLVGDTLAQADSSDVYAQADEIAPRQTGAGGYYGDKDWQAFIAVYLWLSGLNGETGTGNNVSDVDVSFGDIWENFDIGGRLT